MGLKRATGLVASCHSFCLFIVRLTIHIFIIIFQRVTRQKKSQNSKNQGFLTLLLDDCVGSGSASVLRD
jgi:hypothetical protein